MPYKSRIFLSRLRKEIKEMEELCLKEGGVFIYKTEKARKRFITDCLKDAEIKDPDCAIVFLVEYLINHCKVKVTRQTVQNYLDDLLHSSMINWHLNYLTRHNIITEDKEGNLSIKD